MKYKIFFVCISLLLIRSNCQEEENEGVILHDMSFRQFCENSVPGKYIPRANEQSAVGDLCDITFNIASQDDKEAGRFCRQWAPYRIKEATSKDGKTFCQAETTLVCSSGKIQIHGNCYAYLRNQEKLYTYENAESACKEKGAEMATLHRADLPKFWNAFFKNMYQIWVKIPDGVNPKFAYENGNRAAIVYGNAIGYRAKMGSLIKIRNEAVSSVICQWTPTKMGAEQLRETEALKEVYYGSVKESGRIVMPMTNRYGHEAPSVTWQRDACKRAMKPLRAKFVQQAFGEISQFKPLFEKEIVVARAAPYRWDDLPEKRKTSACYQLSTNTKKINEIYSHKITSAKEDLVKVTTAIDEWDQSNLQRENVDECDQFLSSAYVPRSNTVKYWTMSDAFRAPLLCYINYAPKSILFVEPGWTKFTRKTGEVVLHQYNKASVSIYGAAKKCEEENAFLSGFETEEEFDLLKNLCDGDACWLGGERKQVCRWSHLRYYDVDENSECSLKEVFQWMNGVARNGKASILWKYWGYVNNYFTLNYVQQKQFHMAVEKNGLLYDYDSGYNLSFICQKPARTIVV